MKAPSTIFPPYSANWPPDYTKAFEWRQHRISRFRRNPTEFQHAKAYYALNPIEWINEWCTTYDPRNAGLDNKLTYPPLILFKRQEELVQFVYECLQDRQHGLIEKCREFGATWVCAAISVHLWLFMDGAAIGWGSREQDLVDKLGVPKSVFEKMRILIRNLPEDFYPLNFDPDKHMMFMRIINPQNGSTIAGDVGDNIGRGDRALIYFKDESAHYVHPEEIEASLLSTAKVQIDISSVHHNGHVFQQKREAGIDWDPGLQIPDGKIRILVLDWREHPEKTEEWHARERQSMLDQGLLAQFKQEIERDYAASVEGVIIPPEHVQAAIDAHIHLQFDDSGAWMAGLDVADEGGDFNALAVRKGVVLKSCDQWTDVDVGVTTRRVATSLPNLGYVDIQYDAPGVGSTVKAEANRLLREGILSKYLRFVPWQPGGSVLRPDGHVIQYDTKTPLNKDFFGNLKAQAWWDLRQRFERTFRARRDPSFKWTPDQLISISSEIPMLRRLEKQLSQPTIGYNSALKMQVNKKPDGMRSPDMADAVVMCFYPSTPPRFHASPEAKLRMQLPMRSAMGSVKLSQRFQFTKRKHRY